MTKIVYRYDDKGYCLGADTAYESPFEPGVFYAPPQSTELEPLREKDGYHVKWDGKKWEYEEVIKEIEPEPEQHVLTAEEIRKSYSDKLGSVMDTKAQEYGYDSILTAVTYADSTIEKFAKEGGAFKVWRDNVYATGYAYLAEIEAGKKAIPATDEEFIALIPVFTL